MKDDVPQAIHGKAIDTACEDDIAWFEAHPDCEYRLREAVDYEFNFRLPPSCWVIVRQLGPGLRVRAPITVEGAPPPDVTQEEIAEVFQWVLAGGPSLRPRNAPE